MGSNPSSASTTQREVVCADVSSCDATTPDVSAAATLSTDGKEDNNDEEADGGQVVRSRSQEIYLQRKNFTGRKMFAMMRASQDLDMLTEKLAVEGPVEEEEEPVSEAGKPPPEVEEEPLKPEPEVAAPEVVQDQTASAMSLTDDLLSLLNEKRPVSTDGRHNESANSSTASLNRLRHSRSFDSGLPMSPEVRRRLKAISQRSPSELSLFERKRSSTSSMLAALPTSAAPSPGRQSIEDLASSVENLREKLALFPFAARGPKLATGETEEEELDQANLLFIFAFSRSKGLRSESFHPMYVHIHWQDAISSPNLLSAGRLSGGKSNPVRVFSVTDR
jgi:hypothetical protein